MTESSLGVVERDLTSRRTLTRDESQNGIRLGRRVDGRCVDA